MRSAAPPAPARSANSRPAAVAPRAGGCQIGELFAVLGRPHMLEILHAFKQSQGAPLRFNELQSRLGISPKTLASRLRTLVEGGFLARRAYNEIPPRVEYQPTAKTEELSELFRALDRWAERNSVHEVPMVSVVGRVPA
ncbi:MAG TPA: helix-turn-helix domain-containing protein [Thermoplasmata archaeon]|nr:helix-turn-helix domain-containing protein [Thermoplasmata archaeon]